MERKCKFVFIILILMAILSAGKVAADLVTQASNISLSSDKTSKTKVSESLDELYDNTINKIIEAKAECPEGKVCLILNTSGKKCVRATTLHTEVCNNDRSGCKNVIGNGNTITYGNLGTSGTLASGDAFDCDINGDGYLDEVKERFYYVSDLWISGTSYNSNYAVLIYYSNTIVSGNNVIQNNGQGVVYNQNGYNYQGPVTALANIPSTTQWSNISLKSQTRQIYNQTGGTTTNNGSNTLPTYTYTNKVARLLTVQELQSACNITVGSYTAGELDTCSYLMENTYFTNTSNKFGYLLETPHSYNSGGVWCVYVGSRIAATNGANLENGYGVRPVIEILKTDMSY